MWKVSIHKKAQKGARKLPAREQEKLIALIRDLQASGAAQPRWANYSKLGAKQHHCHLSYKWVACWEEADKTLRLIDIYYIGSREDAPY